MAVGRTIEKKPSVPLRIETGHWVRFDWLARRSHQGVRIGRYRPELGGHPKWYSGPGKKLP
jgi:hypothetical protein